MQRGGIFVQEIQLDQPRSGSYLILDTLHQLGVDLVFGYPGGAVLPLYDAIYQYEGIQHILARHEQERSTSRRIR
ncbi:Thiamine pyrophosphate-requiring enzyme [Streptococcus suis 05ZYH33]|nr:Thiamine pyrophosphate-requiring enzyme [Streptococcus suis 05ZYH33]